jgi:hypothetical protein
MKKSILLLCVCGLAGCSTIIEGSSQELTVNTNPPAADCGLYREGAKIAEVANTPGSVKIDKTKHDITVLCVKDGYQQATFLNHSGTAGATLGNIIAGGGIGWAVDSATGSDNKYDSPMNITLVPVIAATPAPAPTKLPATFPPATPTS